MADLGSPTIVISPIHAYSSSYAASPHGVTPTTAGCPAPAADQRATDADSAADANERTADQTVRAESGCPVPEHDAATTGADRGANLRVTD